MTAQNLLLDFLKYWWKGIKTMMSFPGISLCIKKSIDKSNFQPSWFLGIETSSKFKLQEAKDEQGWCGNDKSHGAS